jgi:hypothetical protein
MEVTLALLADYANVTKEGKLNIMGTFDTIFARNFPCRHPQMQLVMRFESDIVEAGRTKDVEIRLIDEDGKESMSISGQLTPAPGKGAPGDKITINHILTLNNIEFAKSGGYEFKILIQEDFKASVPFKLVQITPES